MDEVGLQSERKSMEKIVEKSMINTCEAKKIRLTMGIFSSALF